MNDNFAKWYFVGIIFMIAMFIGGLTIQQWRQMDCRLTLSQTGRPIAEISQICN
jgi:hypothetical protein